MIPREAAHVKRYHTIPTIGQQSVAEHSYHVAMLCIEIQKLNEQDCSAELMKAALFHDLPEQQTGDIPATVKWSHPHLKEALTSIEEDFMLSQGLGTVLTKEEKLVLKYADILELVMYCIDQMNLGNRNAKIVANRGLVFAGTLPHNNGGRKLLSHIQGLFDECE